MCGGGEVLGDRGGLGECEGVWIGKILGECMRGGIGGEWVGNWGLWEGRGRGGFGECVGLG